MAQLSLRFVHLPEMDIMTGHNVQRAFPRHVHDSYCVGLVERGMRVITTRDYETRITSGQVFVLNPAQPHSCHSIGADTLYHVISVRPDVMRSFVQSKTGERSQPPFFGRTRIVHDQLADVIRRLCAYTEPARVSAVDYMQLLDILVTEYGDHVPEIKQPNSWDETIRKACEFIGANYSQKLSLTDLAGVCHMSPCYLQRVFVENSGLSPHDYLVHVRIKHSKTLLRRGLPIAAVAQEVGFVDQSHFTHCFKRIMGITPGYYARQHH